MPNPLLQSIKESLNTIQSTDFKPTYSTTTPELPPQYKAVGQAVVGAAKPIVKPIFGAIKLGLDMIDYAAGAPGSFAQHIKTGQPVKAKKFTEQAGDVSASYFGEGSRLPVELATGFLLPPFGFGGTTKGVIRSTKLTEITTFAEKAAVATKAEDIAREAKRAFPGLADETAEALGRKYVTESDPKKIVDELRDPTPVRRERGVFQRTKTTMPETYSRIKDTGYLVRPTLRSAQAAKNLIGSDLDTARRIATEEFSDQSTFIAAELSAHYSRLAAQAKKTGDLVESEKLRDESARFMNIVARNATEGGHIGQGSSILGKYTPEGIGRFAASEIQKYNAKVPLSKRIPELSGSQAEELREGMRRIQEMVDPDEKARAINALTDKIAGMVPTSLFKKVVTIWKANLLTGLSTSGLNILSTAGNFAAELAKELPAAVVERGTYLATLGKYGKPTIALSLKGLGGGAKEGFVKGWRYLRTGFDERDLDNFLETNKKVSFGTSPYAKAIQRYEESVFRLIGAQDMPFYYGAKARSLYSQAIAQGKGEGLRGAALKRYVDELVQDPTDDMIKYATLDAETATFQNATKIGEVAQSLQKHLSEVIVPFSRTPGAVATQVINYTPAGVVLEIGRIIKRGEFDQRLFSQAMGRAISGTAAMWLGGELFKKGLVTLGYPKSETERKQWEIDGRVPNSIKIGDTWHSVGVLGPVGFTLVTGGYFARGLKESGSPTEAMFEAISSVGSTVTEQSFLRGTNQLIEALQDPSTAMTGFFSGMLGSVIPTIVADTARATDSVERRANEDLFGRLQSRIPGVRQGLEPKVDILGRTKLTPGILESMFHPSRPSKESNDPVVKELRRLFEAGYNSTPTQLGPSKGYSALTSEQNTDLWKMTGREIYRGLSTAISSPGWETLSDEKKEKKIGQFTEDVGIEMRASLIFAITQNLSGSALKEELVRLMEVMGAESEKTVPNNEVYKKFKSYRRSAGLGL